jgi:glutathione peroxidase
MHLTFALSAGVILLLASSAARAAESTTRPAATQPSSVLAFSVEDNAGKQVDLAQYKGKVLLIVNTASKCGFTPQYEGLETIYNKYKDKGFTILAFPANEFGHQEPGTNAEIREFCSTKFHVTFDLFAKMVVKGDGQSPLYQFLTSKESDPKFAGDIKWNFTKFLVSRDGQVVGRFEPKTKPEDPALTNALEEQFNQK